MKPHASRPSARSRCRGPGSSWVLLGLVSALAVMGLLLGVSVEAAVPSVPGATYVGSETCKGCHEDQFTKMDPTLHARVLGEQARTAIQKQSCESCHGPGSKHMEDPANPAFNIRFGPKSQQSVTDQNAVCLQCHLPGKYDGPQHHFHQAGGEGAQCVACHRCRAATMRAKPVAIARHQADTGRSDVPQSPCQLICHLLIN